MQKPTEDFFKRWILTTLAVLVSVKLVPGISFDGLSNLLAASLLLGILNATIKPVLMLLSLPFLLFTLGLFIFVINAVLLNLVAWVIPGFHVKSFGSAFLAAVIISLVQLVIQAFLMPGSFKVSVKGTRNRRVNERPPQRNNEDKDPPSGPVIDV